MFCLHLAAAEEIFIQLFPILIWPQFEIWFFSLYKRMCWLKFLKLERKNLF